MATKKLLLVQRKHSSALINLLRGNYRDIELPNLFASMTTDELTMLKKEDIASVMRKILGNEAIKYNVDNLLSAYFKEALNKATSKISTNEWTFPKGRMQENEDKISCALRELYEEAGIKSDKIWLCPKEYMFTWNVGNCTSLCYIYPAIYLDKVVISDDVKDNCEVGKIDWFTKEDVKDLVNWKDVSTMLAMFETSSTEKCLKTSEEKDKK